MGGHGYAATVTGVSLDTLTTGLKKLSVGLIDAAEGGSSSAAKALERLGISALDASGALKGSDQVLSEVSAKFADMENGAQKTALAIALFGKSGADLIPMLNQSADGIAKLQAEADKLGVTISKETAEAAGRFNENLDKMRLAGQGVAMQLAEHMLPAIEGISSAMVGATNNAAALTAVGRVLGGLLQGLASIAVTVSAAVKLAGYSLFGTFGAALKLMQGDIKGAQEALRWGGQGMVDAATGAMSSLKAIWSGASSPPFMGLRRMAQASGGRKSARAT